MKAILITWLFAAAGIWLGMGLCLWVDPRARSSPRLFTWYLMWVAGGGIFGAFMDSRSQRR